MQYIARFDRLPRPTLAEAIATDKADYYRTSSGGFSMTLHLDKNQVYEETWANGDQLVAERWKKTLAEDLFAVLQPKDGEIRIPAGYGAHVSADGEQLLAESYIACSGNMVVLIHHEDETVLYVNSRRHGIPDLACSFMGITPLREILYESRRPDVAWHVAGLENPKDFDPKIEAITLAIDRDLYGARY